MEKMDPDAEFNLLTALYQSVVHDMKHTYPAWETLSQKAQKLGAQLRATAHCMSAFTEAVQAVCDNANNLKGASRDVGACVTRVCIKQRAIETRMRAWADALCEELSLSLQQRGAYWKARCHDVDKLAAKHVKKVRARKQRPDVTAMSEQRDVCAKVLTEQRAQFAFFTGTLQPVLTAQLNMLDESAHLRQVVDNLDSTLKHVDADRLVASIVSDVAQGPDSAWKQCLAQAGQRWRGTDDCYESSTSTRATTPSDEYSRKPPPILQRRNSEKSIGQFSMSSPNTDGGSSTCLNMPPAYHQYMSQRGSIARPQNLAFAPSTSSCIGATPTVHQPSTPAASSSGGNSALLISEACRDIDQLGSDLENYCTVQEPTRYFLHEMPKQQQPAILQRRASSHIQLEPQAKTLATSNMSNYAPILNQPVRMRTTSASRPPPPTRRSSQITAATPTAPSVAEQRMNGSMGSRQSLDSAGLYDSSQFYHMSSFARNAAGQTAAAVAAAAKFRI